MNDLLKKYKAKRNFAITPEPDSTDAEVGAGGAAALSFVIQKHWATRLHYDFRLELNGAMKSWAVPKGPSLDPHDKRMAVHVEDHPISYNKFEGRIPPKQYGAGKVIIWDKGYWEPIGDAAMDYRAGHLKFDLHGHKLNGRWALVRMKSRGEKQEAWLLIKEKDAFARAADAFSVIDEMPDSVARLKEPARPKSAAESGLKSATPKSAAVKRAHPDDPVQDAVKSALPDKLAPQLATLVDAPPADAEGWQYEIKFDGYRLLTRIEGKSIKLFTRNGNDWTAQLPALAASLAKMKLPPGWYDGEIVALDSNGMPDFQTLQQAFDGSHTQDIVYYLFDLPYCGGYDLRKVQLHERRAMLASLLEKAPAAIRFSETFDIEASEIMASACKMGLEGMIGKRQDSTYELRRSSSWIKLKCSQRQEFLICGYTDPQGSRTAIGSLLLGIHDENGRLRYAGNVGTGFDQRSLAELLKKLEPLHMDAPPFEGPTRRYRKPHWVKPVLLAEVSFAQWTGDGRIRHSVFHGLRTDKKPRAITREKPVAVKSVSSASAASPRSRKSSKSSDSSNLQQAFAAQPQSPLAGLKITHPERVIDASTGATKIDLIRYYALVAPLMMAHLQSRPVSLVRAPDGIEGQLFFQKHFERANMPGIRALSKSLDTDHPPYLEVAEPTGLLSAAQMNVIEFHTWNGVKSTINKPDRFSFDLDPGEKSEWPAMQEAALLVRSFLLELKLESLIKTSGGKGLHVVVPIRKQYDWDTIKDFSRTIVEHLAATLPERFSAKSGPRNRVGKIFIDYLRNGFGATTACAWTARARPGLGVSVPIAWDEVEKLHGSAQWNIANIHTRLDHGNAPWENVQFLSQSVTPGMKILGFEAESKKK
ncbi:MAG TPA: DNA ligase D [Herbaspirillum sp.]|jgi:bifunctional non-homologous end joining protein LigD